MSTARLLAALSALLLTAAAPAADRVPPPRSVARQVEQYLQAHVPADGPGMAVLVARGDQVIYRGARGMASIELGVPLSPDHVFRIGSVTKQFAAAGVLRLVDEGRVSLDDPLSRYLPDYPGGGNITIAQLLNHTSGIQNYTDIPGYMDADVRRDLDTAGLIAVFRDRPVRFPPGTSWEYNNSGYVLAGAVIEKVTGGSWSAYLDEVFFQPLGMRHTHDPGMNAVVPGHVSGYSRSGDRVVPAALVSMTQTHAAGALLSSVDDLLRWNRALHGGKLLSAESYQRMITPEGAAVQARYGYGIAAGTVRNRPALEHNGGIFGFVTDLVYLPGDGITVAVLANTDDNDRVQVERTARRLAAIALGDPYPDFRPVQVPEAELEALEGVYRRDENTARVLRMKDGVLTSQRSGGPVFSLVPFGNDRFGFGDGSLSWLQIERDGTGKVTGMRYYPEGEGDGELWPLTDEPLPEERKTVELPREALERLVGGYDAEVVSWRVFFDDGGVLRVQIPGQPAFELHATSPTTFHIAEVDARFTFAPETGDVQTCTLDQGAVHLVARRTPD